MIPCLYFPQILFHLIKDGCHRIREGWRLDPQRSSGPSPLFKQGHLDPLIQDQLQLFFLNISTDTPPLSWAICASAWSTSQQEVFPVADIKRKPVFQFMPTASCPASGHHWEVVVSILFAPSLQVLLCALNAFITVKTLLSLLFPSLPFSQPFLIERILQFLSHLQGPLLDSLQYIPVFLVIPELGHSKSRSI